MQSSPFFAFGKQKVRLSFARGSRASIARAKLSVASNEVLVTRPAPMVRVDCGSTGRPLPSRDPQPVQSDRTVPPACGPAPHLAQALQSKELCEMSPSHISARTAVDTLLPVRARSSCEEEIEDPPLDPSFRRNSLSPCRQLRRC